MDAKCVINPSYYFFLKPVLLNLDLISHLHKERKVPRNDLSNYSDRFMSSVTVIVSIHRYHLTMMLIRPTSVVTVTFYTKINNLSSI